MFYAIETKKGKRVFPTWAECENFRNECPNGARYKKFSCEADAWAFLNGTAPTSLPETTPTENGVCMPMTGAEAAVAYVDGSFNINTCEAGYGVVLFDRNNENKKLHLSGSTHRHIESRNISGEVTGAVIAIEEAVKLGCKSILIYYDYAGIEAWAIGSWAARSDIASWYKNQIDKLSKQIKIEFKKVKAHSGVKYNEVADALAKKAVGM